MNRMQFMEILESKLSDISEAEKKEAITYYEDYFNDAGVENEQEVLESLGTPEEVAKSIREDLSGKVEGEYTETGYRNQNENPKNPLGMSYEKQNNEYQKEKHQKGKERDTTKIILAILLCICAIPIAVPLGVAAFASIAGVLLGLLGLLVGIGACGFALLLAGVICIVVGIVKLFINPLVGAVALGIGLIMAGIGLVMAIMTIYVCVKVAPALIQGIVKLLRKPFERRR